MFQGKRTFHNLFTIPNVEKLDLRISDPPAVGCMCVAVLYRSRDVNIWISPPGLKVGPDGRKLMGEICRSRDGYFQFSGATSWLQYIWSIYLSGALNI